MHSKIILIGFMGTGKSSTSSLLASRLGYSLVDVDTLLLQRSGYASISDIFRDKGEAGFRKLETEAAISLSANQDVVISTGGGIITRPENMEALKRNGGICILLHASFAEIQRRVGDTTDRPLLHDKAKAEVLYNSRQALYRAYADITVNTEGKSVPEVCEEIAELVSQHVR